MDATISTNFAEHYGPWALVAGASDGIGEAYAHEIARRGVNVALLARRGAVLDEVATALQAQHGVETRTIVADLTDPKLGDIVGAAVAGLDVGLLVYNAGAVHAAKKFLDRPIADATQLVDLNCRGPITLVHLLGPGMRTRRRGGIVLMSSMAALAGASYIATYAATKAFDIILAEALWHELGPEGIHVCSVIAGATDTPSMRSSNDKFGDYDGLMDPNDVAVQALDHLGQGPTLVPGDANRQVAATIWPSSRVQLSNMMSNATADMYGLPHIAVEGRDFNDG